MSSEVIAETTMPGATLEALRGSIAHWERLAACETPGQINHEGVSNKECALCRIFFYNACNGCPVNKSGECRRCANTPYDAASAYWIDTKYDDCTFELTKWRILATAELDFLKSLLPKTEGQP